MSSIALDIQHILDLASEYSKDQTPAMLERAATGANLAQELAKALEEIAKRPGMADLDLQVKAGGRQSSFGPVPWVRMYSTRYAPSAQQGIYLVYLFAADGSRAYLSLMQGTSVPKPGGGMRATSNRSGLLSRADEARTQLGDLNDAMEASGAVSSIDLAWQELKSPASRNRARAYEVANILAREYLSRQIPPDEQLLTDLIDMLHALTRLYGITLAAPEAVSVRGVSFDADSLQRLAATDRKLEIDRQVYRAVVAAINSGKHVILTGPPGTAKTTLAELTCQLATDTGLCSGYRLTTATADWTTYETIGGLRPTGSAGSLEFHEGLFLEAIRAGRWLVIDELNRSNFDRAFGQLFTVLSGQSVVLPYEDPKRRKPVALVLEGGADTYSAADYAALMVPKKWRIIATMNVFDKSLLFEMSFALMRRFAFIEVPAPPKEAFTTLWRRELEGSPQESMHLVDHALMDLFDALSELHFKDIGPAVFIDMANFGKAYIATDSETSAQELTFQLFYSYLLPQFEGISTPQGRQLFKRIGNLVTSRRAQLRTMLTDVLGVDLRSEKPADEEDDPLGGDVNRYLPLDAE